MLGIHIVEKVLGLKPKLVYMRKIKKLLKLSIKLYFGTSMEENKTLQRLFINL